MKKINNFLEFKKFENTSATGGPISSGSGAVSSVPSHFPGPSTGQNWIAGGIKSDTEDIIGVPYNPGGPERIFHNIKNPIKKRGSKVWDRAPKKMPNTKTRMPKKPERVFSFDDFSKSQFSMIEKK
jgi:hypothetical protein